MSHRAPGPPPWSLLAAALLLCPPPARGGPSPPLVLLQDPPAAGPGDNVTFLLTPPPGPFIVCSWFRGGDTETSAELFSFFPGGPGQLDGPAQTGRAWGDQRGSLHLVGVAPEDAGLYSVLLRRPEAAAGSARLLVHVPLPEPSVTPENVTVTENETLSLSCHPPDGTVWVSWLHWGAPLAPGGRVSLSPDNRTLTVPRAQRGDAGPFACRVSNALSANRSRDVPVTVLYGPDAVTVTPPGPLDLLAGSPLTLTCAADAVPTPQYTWTFGDTRHFGATWALGPVSPAHGGGYVCRATNPQSGASRDSARLELRVWEPLPEPSVTPENVTVTENETLSLSCHPPNGTVWVSWLHWGAPLAPGGRVSLSPDNRTLTVPRAQRGDAGPFACRVSNALSANRSRDVPVTVLYGPDAVAVSPPGPLHLPLGSLVDLGCSAASVPPPEFSWARGNVTVATGPHLTLTLQDSGQSGPWSCRATNPALGRAAEATVLLQLEQGLSPGAIAGIVVGTLLGLVLLGAGGFLLWRHLGRVSTPTNGAKPSAPPYKEPQDPPPALGPPGSGGGHSPPPGPTETPEEVKYTTVTLRPPGGAAPPRPPQPNDTVYSEVRRK